MSCPHRALALLLLLSSLSFAACVPARVKQLNAEGQKAYFDRKYDRAVALFGESLAIYPQQPKIRQHLDNAKTMLKQIYVYKIYELVDASNEPIETYLKAWKMSAQLPELGVPKARVGSIRLDLDKRLRKSAPRLHKSTEGHKYYHHLDRMAGMVPSTVVDQAQAKIADKLQQEHLEGRKAAEAAQLDGLALLHTLAAATFAPGDTGLWADGSRRRKALLAKLAIDVSLAARSKAGGRHSAYLLGSLKRRLPRIFRVAPKAPLTLTLDAMRATPSERRVRDRRSARCQVGVKRVPNPACPSLTRQAKAARAEIDARVRALDTARQRCAGVKLSDCTRYLSDAERELQRQRRRHKSIEHKASRCPAVLRKPIYRTFFYDRFTVTRRVTASGRVTLTKGGSPWRARGVSGSASASDITGPGLACARVAADPLKLPAISSLTLSAEAQLVHRSLVELRQLRREKAKAQLAGRDTEDKRLDAMVRARLVDETYRAVARQLSAQLKGQWTTDFGLTKRIVR
jgi:hypothetical protein